MDAVVIRFPDGTKEFRFPGQPLLEGDIVWHDGKRWRVVSLAADSAGHDVATVEIASDEVTDMLRSEEGAIRLEPLP